MAYQSRQTDACAEINDAQRAVKAATAKYERGGKPEELNKANRRLADAVQSLYRTASGLALDDR